MGFGFTKKGLVPITFGWLWESEKSRYSHLCGLQLLPSPLLCSPSFSSPAFVQLLLSGEGVQLLLLQRQQGDPPLLPQSSSLAQFRLSIALADLIEPSAPLSSSSPVTTSRSFFLQRLQDSYRLIFQEAWESVRIL
ncbi:hypothetical protein KSP39_PZI009207 [Platanthera zijinensis]|uniref:Uncharacterized protein n=1 Tax=Platanthera zijinensis TaxID=2320716 RepID=A0AAP0G7S3_9ASPA